MTNGVEIDVVVPSYKRPVLLERCLTALAQQSHQPGAIVVVVDVDDEDSKALLATVAGELAALMVVEVTEPGVIAAITAGVGRSSAPLIAFTDDDARPHVDWLARIVEQFRDRAVGGVGGRDMVAGQERPLTQNVGRFSRSGRLVGGHHLGTGGRRDVHVLKGVNMAFRAEALALPAPRILRGNGAQVDFEVLICAWARQHGWRLVYDPEIIVDHEGALRHGSDRRVRPERSAVFDAAYNSVVAAAALDRPLPLARVIFPIAVGTRDRPGVIRAGVAAFRREREVLRRVPPALAGRFRAALRLVELRRLGARAIVVPATQLRPGHLSQPRPVVALVAHDVHERGGMERACAELIRRGNERVDFILVASDLAPDLLPLVRRWVKIRVPRRPFPLKFAVFWFLAGRAINRLNVDIVHTVGAIVPNRVDVASLHFCHAGFRALNGGLAPRGSSLVRRTNTAVSRALALAAERWSYRPSRLRAFAAVSEGVAHEAARFYSAIPVTVTPNGVDLDRFRPDPVTRTTLRASEGIADCTVALFVGGDWDRKGLHIAIEAVAKARARGHDLFLWVVGRGNADQFVARSERLGATPANRFFGPRTDTERFYQAADIFVLPSVYESFSLVGFEAAACGLPLVITAISGASDLVGSGEGGLIVERSSESVAEALVTLSADPMTRARLGAEARRRASAYTWQRSVASVMNLYGSLLEGWRGQSGKSGA
jgi:UDP-glucose:(heptosyl)LPS alpha-1,3-glucosyltransferase